MNDNDAEGLAKAVLAAAEAQGMMIATAESCTGGMLGAALTAIPGSSTVYERGFVTYSNDAKRQMLDVSGETLVDHGAVSEAVAGEMALGALRNSAAHLAVSITGIAGPGGSEHKPEGRVCFGIAQHDSAAWTGTVEFGASGRDAVRRAAVLHALELLAKTLRI